VTPTDHLEVARLQQQVARLQTDNAMLRRRLGLVTLDPDRDGEAHRLIAVAVVGSEETFHVGLPVEAISEVVAAAAVSPLEGVPVWVRGSINLRGETAPVIDVAARLTEVPPAALEPHHQMVVVRVFNRPAVLVVDQVERLLSVASDSLDRVDGVAFSHVVVGVLQDAGVQVQVLSLEALVAAVPADVQSEDA